MKVRLYQSFENVELLIKFKKTLTKMIFDFGTWKQRDGKINQIWIFYEKAISYGTVIF